MISGETMEQVAKSVCLCIDSRLVVLNGSWTWDMQSNAVYCSNVMSFPAFFEGTKGIIHPDDLGGVTAALELLHDKEIPNLDFRLITTYGEVKFISGTGISSVDDLPYFSEQGPVTEPWEAAVQSIAFRKEKESLKLRNLLKEASEKLEGSGSWFVNKTTGEAWYSDHVFRIYGLPPQSLNSHTNTFYSFIHDQDRATVEEAFEQAYLQEVPLHIEFRIVQPDGTVCYVQHLTQWLYAHNGNRIFCGSVKNITEERALHNHLKAAEEQQALLQRVMGQTEQQSMTGSWYMNLVTRKTVYSENYYRIYGLKYTTSAYLHSFLNLVHPEDKEMVSGLMDKMQKEHVLSEMEFRIIRPDGKERHLRQSARVFIHADGQLLMIGMVQDITTLKSLEKKVKDAEKIALLQQLVMTSAEHLAGISSVVWRPDGTMEWSDEFFRLLGYKPGALDPLPRMIYKSLHPEDIKTFKSAERAVLAGEDQEDVRFRVISKLGIRQFQISFLRKKLDEVETVVGIIHDVTGEQQRQEQLEEKTRLALLLAESNPDPLFLTNRDHTVVSWNEGAVKKTGITRETALHANLFDLFPALNEESYLDRLQAVLYGEKNSGTETGEAYLKKPHQYSLLPLKNDAGEAEGVLHIVQDISRELQLQQQLSDRLNFIESLVESSVDRIIVLDKSMNYLYWNRKAEEYYAINKEKVLGRNIMEIFPAFRNDPGYQEFRKVLRGETVHLQPAFREDSSEYFETWLTPIKNGQGDVEAVLWVVHDLSAEWNFQYSQRKAAELLKEEHRRLKEAQAVGHVGSFEWDALKDTIHWSDEMYRVHGLKPQSERITRERVFSFFELESLKEVREKLIHCMLVPCEVNVIHKLVLPNGDVRYIDRRLRSIGDESGRVTFLSGTAQDITDRVLAEQELKESKLFIEQIMNATPDFIIVFNLITNKNDFVNRAAYKQDEERYQETLLLNYEGILARAHPDDRESLHRFINSFRTAADGDIHTLEYRVVRDTNVIWYRSRGKVFRRDESGSPTHYISIVQDITDAKEAGQKLKESIELLQQTTIATPDALIIYDVRHKQPIYLNSCLEEWVGYKNEELISMGMHGRLKLVHPDDRDRLLAFNQLLNESEDGRVMTLEYRLKGREEKMLWLRNRSKVFKRDENDQVTHYLTVLQDVTEEVHLRQELVQRSQFIETLIDHSIDRVLVIGTDNSIIAWNRRCEEVYHINREFAIGKNFFELFPKLKEDQPIKEAIEKAKGGEAVHLPLRQEIYHHGFSELFYVPLLHENGEVYAILHLLHDVSKMYGVQTELKALNKTLEEKNRELEEKAEEISSFAFIASHDLKEPLRKIHTFSDWLQNQESEKLSTTGKAYIKKIINAVRRMDTLIGDVLVLTRIDSEKSTGKTIDLNAVLERARAEMREEIDSKGVEIIAEQLPLIKGNDTQLHYLFRNLISNAIKFQPEGSAPVLRISAEQVAGEGEGAGDFHKISFEDNGIGIEEKYFRKIFQVFQRLHGNKEFDGTGIGLAICRKVLEIHGGFMKVESTPGKGSVFHCYFPMEVL